MEPKLTVTDIKTYVVGAKWRNYVLVELETDGGIVGLGEATLEGYAGAVTGAIDDLRSLIVGQNPFRIEHIWQQVYRHSFWRGGPVILSALSGIEVALWDIKGQALGVPIHTLLGGPVRDKIKMYANGPRGETPDQVAESAVSLVKRGFRAVKWAPFPATPVLGGKRFIEHGVAQVRAVREAVGPEVEILVDAHGRLSPAMAIRAADALAPFRIFFLEEPVLPENVPALARVAAKSPIPIASGERLFTKFGFREVLERRNVAVLQPDLAHAGGLYELRKIAAMAEAHFVSIAPHNPLSWVNTMATLHLDLVTPNFLIQEFVADDEPWKDEIVDAPLPLSADGYMTVPSKPGLGLRLNHDAVKRFPPVTARTPIFWHDDGSVADW